MNNIFKSALTLGAMGIASAVNAKDKPNVVLLFVDDMTYDGIAALGNDEVKTPNIDRLVRSGTAFMNTFNMGGWNGAISVASRSMLLTGQYVWHSYESSKKKYAANVDAGQTLPQVMKNAGYQTYMTGKWHIDYVTPEKLYDTTEDVRPGGCPDCVIEQYDRPVSHQDSRWLPWDTQWGGYWKGGRHWTEVQADDIVRYINNNAKAEKPYFMYCAFNAPHDPRQAPKEFVDMYDVDKIKVPVNFLPEHPLKKQMGCDQNMRDERLAPFPRTEYAVRKHRQEYYAIISHLDREIGRILDAIRDSGQEKNTIVVFAADNGLGCGQHGLMGKQNMYDHSMKVPLVISGPGVPKNQKRTCMNYVQDWVPTVYELAGIKIPGSMEFKSLVPALKNPKAAHYSNIYGAFTAMHQRMIRTADYKLVFIPQAHTIYLFDMKKDPHETKNLADDPQYAEVIDKLAKDYLALAGQMNDPLAITDYYPGVFK